MITQGYSCQISGGGGNPGAPLPLYETLIGMWYRRVCGVWDEV